MNCKKCFKYPIYNVHFQLCIYCNKKRLNEKRTNNPNNATSQRTTRKATKPSKSASAICSKEREKKKRQFREKIIIERPNVCESCLGSTDLTFSHTIPVSIRKDLEFEEANVIIECMKCHYIWEHGTIQQKQTLLSYKAKTEYIRKTDILYYNRKFQK